MRQQAGIRVRPVAVVAPADAGKGVIVVGQCLAPLRRGATRCDRAEASGFCDCPFAQVAQQGEEAGIVQCRMPGWPTHQQHGARLRQCRKLRRIVSRLRQPQVVDWMQAAEHRNDVVAVESVVFRCDDEIPVSGIDARIEDLYGLAAARAQQPRGQCRLPAAADRELRWPRDAGIERVAEGRRCAGQGVRREPAPWRARLQEAFAGIGVQRACQR